MSDKPGIAREAFIEDLARWAELARVRVIFLRCAGGERADETLADRVMLALQTHETTQQAPRDGEGRPVPIREHSPLHTAPGGPIHRNPAGTFCAAVRRRMRSAGAVLLVLDDLQNADDLSVRLMTTVAWESRRMPLMIVATCPSLRQRNNSFHRKLAGFAAVASHVELAGSDGELSGEFVDAAEIRSEMNPGLVSESAGRAPLSLDEDPQTAEEKRCDLFIAAGEANIATGDYAAAQDLLRQAAELADVLGDVERLTRIVVALPCWYWPGIGETNALALLLAQRGLAVNAENNWLGAVLMARLAAELSSFRSQEQYSRELASAAANLAIEKDSRTRLHVRLFRDPILRHPELSSERLENAEQIARLAIEVGDYSAYVLGCVAKSASLLVRGELARAYDLAEMTAKIVPITSSPLHKGISIAWNLSRAVIEGRFGEAQEAFDRCRDFAAKYRIPHLLDACWPAMLIPLNEADRLAELETVAEETVRRRPGAAVYGALLSWVKMRLRRRQDASFLFDRLAADDFVSLVRSEGGWIGMAVLTDVCIGLDRTDHAAALYDRLLPYAGFNAAFGVVAVFGSVETFLGKLAAVLGRLDDAVGHFEKSFSYNRRIGARPCGAYSQWELARTLMARGTPGDYARAAELLTQLEAEAVQLDMRNLLSRTRQLRERLCTVNHSQVAQLVTASPDPMISRSGAQRSEISHCVPAPSENCQSDSGRSARFCRRGEFWELGFEGRTFLLRHRRGLAVIHFLLCHAASEFSAMELVHVGSSRSAGAHDVETVHGGTGPILDTPAKQAYRRRIKELSQELEEARDANDLERAVNIEAERDFLTRELARAVGLFNRDRTFSSEPERARKCVSMAISRTIRVIIRQDEEFGRFLERSIRTGNLCSYRPESNNRFTMVRDQQDIPVQKHSN